MPTIYDVAKRAGVSTYTVSSVINKSAFVSPELTARVEKAVLDLDYTPNAVARSLQTRNTQTIGMLIPDIGNPFYATVVQGVEDTLRREGYSLILGSSYDHVEEQARYLGVFRSKLIDGLLIYIAAGDQSEVRRMVEARRPVVFVGRLPQGFTADSITADNAKGTQLILDHLISKGHRDIAMLLGHHSLSTVTERVDGWKKAMRRHRIKARPELICEGDWSEASAYAAAKDLLKLPERPTAIVAVNFPMLAGALRAIREAGLRCPEDVECASSDDYDWLDLFHPPITTITQHNYSIGEEAARLVLQRIKQPDRAFQQITIEPQLRIRG
ncbi:MAG: LacI family DNA-binding transcriptional regulator [Acidobacteria bacterium]|nr:LacI family DNA-binding transcriptional regulator [Acidobacteriota bacterium]